MLTSSMNIASLRCLWIPQVENSPHIISCPGLKGAVWDSVKEAAQPSKERMRPEINMGMMRINTDNAPVRKDAPEGRIIYLGSFGPLSFCFRDFPL